MTTRVGELSGRTQFQRLEMIMSFFSNERPQVLSRGEPQNWGAFGPSALEQRRACPPKNMTLTVRGTYVEVVVPCHTV